ncbi:MAG TPA: hypothetical protein VIU11_14365 [Nakamurella sp.]
MGFDKPTRSGGDFPDLKAETQNGPRLLACRVLDFLPSEEGDYPDPNNPGAKSKVYPVRCDIMIIDGPHAGWIYRNWTARYAFTNALRGASGTDPTPSTHPGAELAIRAERSTKKGVATSTVWGNEPSDPELDLIETEFERFGGWDGPGIARDKVPAMAGATAGASSPAAPAPAAPAGQATGSAPRRPFGRRA